MNSSNTSPSLSPSTSFKLPLGAWIVLTGSLACSIGGAIGNHYIAQNQITQHERRIERIEDERKGDRELLTRIDERTAEIKRQLERQNSK